ncbi:glycosyltransferase domain-containing protein [Fusobacterium mortiferum]|uniref:glycosyltransferase domain-containing protein n=1 Tax=Fusobacterium mortiferum TaxID=850 RepID=UPI00158902D7|nr:glycosyltransferase domain-containing protein [Fusobacterium mortiferum]
MLKDILKKNKFIYNLLSNIKFQYLLKKEKIKNFYYWIEMKKKKSKYQNYQQTRKAKGVIYTCIIGDYDSLKTHKYIDFDWDYICYTNNKNIKSDGIWKIKELEFDKLDNSKNNRWHKLNPHLLFKEYEESIYLDGNVRILSKDFFKLIDKNDLFISTKHPQRKCLYKEAIECKKLKLEKKEIIDKQIEKIKKAGFPQNYGLYEANILYRKHNKEKIIKMDEEWWDFVSKQAKRDQLSLTYVCWKNNVPFRTFLDISFREKNKYIEITPHLIRRK